MVNVSESRLHLVDSSCKERSKAPFPIDLHSIVHVFFQREKNRLNFVCYLPSAKRSSRLELTTISFKCVEEDHRINDWMDGLSPQLSGSYVELGRWADSWCT
jgi:hypothetical protein